jgi:hypothetical protein
MANKSNLAVVPKPNKQIQEVRSQAFNCLQKVRELSFHTEDGQEERALNAVEGFLVAAIKRLEHQAKKQ